MLEALLLIAACAPQAPVSPPAPPPPRRWPLGFRVAEVDAVTEGNWVSYMAENCRAEIRGDASSLEVDFGGSDGYVGVEIHFWLSPTGVQVTARHGDCTSLWVGEHIAGTASLVTDGKSAALEFEIYDGGTEWFESLVGRAQLGTKGAELAQRYTPPPRATGGRTTTVEFTNSPDMFAALEGRGDKFEAFGLVDVFGRRQGLWTVRKPGKEPTLEMSWRDGRPEGVFRRHADEYTELEVGSFADGFQDGQVVTWRRGGERTVTEWSRGSLQRITSYDVGGAILREHVLPTTPRDIYLENVARLHTRR